MPAWTQIVVLVATPIFAFAGALIGHWAHRKSAREHDTWRRREETFRTLRWAAEQTTMDSVRARMVGVTMLKSLLASELLQEYDQAMVQSIAEQVTQDLLGAYPGSSEGEHDAADE